MSKKKKDLPVSTLRELTTPAISWKTNPLVHTILLFTVAFIFYSNSINHGYALDDGLVLSENKFVKQGIDGIGDILTHDSFYGTIGDAANLTGGRYRPLSLISFAIEYEMFGNSPVVFHFFNVLFYAITSILIYSFLRRHVFKQNQLNALCASLLFIIHPIHTEVVANIKSRDEILSFAYLLLTLDFLLIYVNGGRKVWQLIVSLTCFFLGLLAKENGLMFIGIVPLSLYFFTTLKPKQIAILSAAFIGLVGTYVFMRVAFIGFNNQKVTELMDAPYLLATPSQKYSTIIFVLLKYLKLLFWPSPLTYDYSYNQIPYRNITDLLVWLSLIVHVALVGMILWGIKQKNLLAWCAGFYLFSMFIVSNFVINIGAPMGERFLYQASFAFSIALVALANFMFSKFSISSKNQITISAVLILVTSIPCFSATVARNKIWKDGITLGAHDVHTSFNSARALTFAGVNYVKMSDSTKIASEKKSALDTAIFYFNRSLSINPKFSSTWLNLGVAYYREEKFDSAEWAWKNDYALSSQNVTAKQYLSLIGDHYSNAALAAGNRNRLDSALTLYQKALTYQPNNAAIFHNMGNAFAMQHQYDSCIVYFQKAVSLDSTKALYYFDLGGIQFNLHHYSDAKNNWMRCKKLNPNYEGIDQALMAAEALTGK